ncbi:MAG: NAD(+) synthase [Deltaproteobacteria bacterium]|nr:NAD(+) synthase [Deltaproteobacteria bacterium]
MSFLLSKYGFVRVGVAIPELRVGDVAFNGEQIGRAMERAAEAGCSLLLCPELSLTASTCADLFRQSALLERSERALRHLAERSAATGVTVIVGAPLRHAGRLFNCAFVLEAGTCIGVVPKERPASLAGVNENRWFAPGDGADMAEVTLWDEVTAPFGSDLLFCARNLRDCLFAVTPGAAWRDIDGICARQAAAEATLLFNPAADPELTGSADKRRALLENRALRCNAAVLYAGAGPGESTTDMVFGGHGLIVEPDGIAAETARFRFETQVVFADLDVGMLAAARENGLLAESVRAFRRVPFTLRERAVDQLLAKVDAAPFVPSDPQELAARCEEVFTLQTTALIRRLRHTRAERLVLGFSGGIDSTLALLVAVRACDLLELERTSVLTLSMPGFGTSGRTRGNAEKLAELLGVDFRTLDITTAVRQHFQDIAQPEDRHDVTYENAQARERTQILMDLANQTNGLVVGTGDLSETALGWCTYNGDHISMYNVNGGIPKTLMYKVVEWCASNEFSTAAQVLADIRATPVSPELLPAGENGAQETERSIGPYRLHDFFLYHAVGRRCPPRKVLFLAGEAFRDEYEESFVRDCLRRFYRRFFSQQFKRSCMVDGPQIGAVGLSPRGGWLMPSDACGALWLEELES